MAQIQRRVGKTGVESWRVGWREGGRLTWSPAIETGEGAAEMKRLVETIGPGAALAVLASRSGRTPAGAAPLLRDYLERHLDLLSSSATPGTIADYRRMAERTWLPMLGPLPLDAITREAVSGWVAAQRKQIVKRTGKPYSAKSIRNAHGLLSSVLAAAVQDRTVPQVAENVAYRTRLPHDEVGHELEILTADEWTALEAAMQEHYRPLLRFLVATGCRFGEATALQVRDVDTARGTVRIRRAWKKAEHGVYLGAPKSRRSVRTVVVGPTVVADLEAACKGKDADALVFPSAEGKRIQSQHFNTRQWARAKAAAGITKELTVHDLRHTSASFLLIHGESPIVVQHRLGHESLATTSKVYAHLLTDEQAGAAAALDELIAPRRIGA